MRLIRRLKLAEGAGMEQQRLVQKALHRHDFADVDLVVAARITGVGAAFEVSGRAGEQGRAGDPVRSS